jgi:tRNA A22 N-methylase
MKTFIEFIEQKNLKRKYISVIYDQSSQKKLRDWCIKNGFDLTKSYDEKDQNEKDFEFHTTIF